MPKQQLATSAVVLLAGLVLTACGTSTKIDEYLPDQRLEYKKQREAADNLELPPDLTAGTFDDALDVPDLSGSATYSEYVGERSKRRAVAGTGAVLPEVGNVELRREGDNRWLEIQGTPQEVWPRVVSFWREQGILLTEQDPTAGVMRTDWLENRAEIRRDIVTNTLRKVMDGLYETGTRDQYRVRIEPGLARNSTDLYLTHRGMNERMVRDSAGEGVSTVWEPAPSDPGKEAEMLRRLMVYLGVTEQRAGQAVAGASGAAAPKSRLTQAGGGTALVIDEDFRNAWRLVGVALDRVGFAVEDRDRTQGVYYVRYDDPNKGQEKEGFMSRLAFWRGDEVDTVSQFRVQLTQEGSSQTRVVVRDEAGQRSDSPTAQRILTLLNEEIR